MRVNCKRRFRIILQRYFPDMTNFDELIEKLLDAVEESFSEAAT